MRNRSWMRKLAPMFVIVTALLGGCAKSDTAPAKAAKTGQATDLQTVATSDDHSGWWCPEHGVPEEVCALCCSKLAAEYQKKGDWCEKHERPESQCFICHPELEAKFAAQYEAKFGEKPPKPNG